MKFDNIGVKVRVLRKERGLTQENWRRWLKLASII